MGFFSSLWRAISTLFGLAEGGTEKATDKLLTSSPEIISAQFRKTQQDMVKDYNQMKDAVAELCKIREGKQNEVERLHKEANDLATKMAGAIRVYKDKQDEKMREAYGRFAAAKTKADQRVDELVNEITTQNSTIEAYKGRLMSLEQDIKDLKQEEAETIADLVSSRKITELNDKLKGLSQDTQVKNIEAIRDARLKAKANAKLSAELSGNSNIDLDNKLIEAGHASIYLSEFDEAVKLDKMFPSKAEPKQLAGHNAELDAEFTDVEQTENTEAKVEALFKK